MTWARLDDHFDDDPDLDQISEAAAILHICGTTWCSRKMTDGRVPKASIRKLKGGDQPHAVAELVAVGWWIEHDDYYLIRSFLKYNPTADEVRESRAARIEWGRNGGIRSAEARKMKAIEGPAEAKPQAEASAKRQAKSNPGPGPVPGSGLTPGPIPCLKSAGGRARAMDLFEPPSREECRAYFLERFGQTEWADDFFDHFDNVRWRLSGGNGPVMADWTLAANRWGREQERRIAIGKKNRPAATFREAKEKSLGEMDEETRAILRRGEEERGPPHPPSQGEGSPFPTGREGKVVASR